MKKINKFKTYYVTVDRADGLSHISSPDFSTKKEAKKYAKSKVCPDAIVKLVKITEIQETEIVK